MFNPEDDGVTHINIYSKGNTKLGRFLSNFARHQFECEDGKFQSIEGYWYWLSSKDDKLRTLYGWEAKKYGRHIRAKDWVNDIDFINKICSAIEIKIKTSQYLEEFKTSSVPFDHYYLYGAKVVRPTEGRWILEFIDSLRKDNNERT